MFALVQFLNSKSRNIIRTELIKNFYHEDPKRFEKKYRVSSQENSLKTYHDQAQVLKTADTFAELSTTMQQQRPIVKPNRYLQSASSVDEDEARSMQHVKKKLHLQALREKNETQAEVHRGAMERIMQRAASQQSTQPKATLLDARNTKSASQPTSHVSKDTNSRKKQQEKENFSHSKNSTSDSAAKNKVKAVTNSSAEHVENNRSKPKQLKTPAATIHQRTPSAGKNPTPDKHEQILPAAAVSPPAQRTSKSTMSSLPQSQSILGPKLINYPSVDLITKSTSDKQARVQQAKAVNCQESSTPPLTGLLTAHSHPVLVPRNPPSTFQNKPAIEKNSNAQKKCNPDCPSILELRETTKKLTSARKETVETKKQLELALKKVMETEKQLELALQESEETQKQLALALEETDKLKSNMQNNDISMEEVNHRLGTIQEQTSNIIEKLSNNPQETTKNLIDIGTVKDSQVHIGRNYYIDSFDYDKLQFSSETPSAYVRNLAVLLFGEATLRASSTCGKKCPRFPTAAVRPELCPKKMKAIEDNLKHWLSNREFSESDIKIHIAHINKYVGSKISDLRRPPRKSHKKKQVVQESEEEEEQEEEEESGQGFRYATSVQDDNSIDDDNSQNSSDSSQRTYFNSQCVSRTQESENEVVESDSDIDEVLKHIENDTYSRHTYTGMLTFAGL